MTQLSLLTRPSVNLEGLCPQARKVARLFLSRPGQWIDAHELLQVGGFAAWRTRISDCRTQAGMVIENVTKRHPGHTESFYRYVPGAER